MSNRRQFLRIGTGTFAVTAGCLGSEETSSDIPTTGADPTDTPTETEPTNTATEADPTETSTPTDTDGYPPEFEETPDSRSIDPSSFETVTRDGVEVRLAPIDVAHYWYRRREARFADARGESQYRRSHVYGAVWSPAGGNRADDPVVDWPKSDRIVCYCGCPHHLSSIRASALIDSGYENVFVIDEGFWEWHDRGYPMVGTEVEDAPAVHVIRGRTDPGDAGRSAWVRHEPTGQFEATGIDSDGGYRLEIRFADLSSRSRLTVETPSYRLERPLADLTDGVITG